jgi:hypothetical protein
VTLAVLLGCAAARGDWFFDAGAQAEYDDNLPRAQADRDIEHDWAMRADVLAGQYFQVADHVGVSVSANAGGEALTEFSGLNHVSAGAAAALRAKLGLGSRAPWLRLGLGATRYDFDHEPRDGWRYNASVATGLRASERWDLQLRYQWERRRSDEIVDIPFLKQNLGIGGEAFDTDAWAFSVAGTYTLSQNVAVVLDYTRRGGDVTATTRRGPAVFQVSDAITPDTVFGFDRFAYRLPADTNVFSGTLSWALGDHVAINFGYAYQDSSADAGFDYQNNIVRLGVLYRY